MNYPIALNYTTTLRAGDKYRPQQEEEFKNPYNSHMWVDTVTFDCKLASEVVAGINFIGKALKMRLKVDNRFVVEDFVPLTLLGPRTDASEDTFSSDLAVNLNITWQLPKPLWIAKGETFSIELFYDNGEILALCANSSALVTAAQLAQQVTVNTCIKARSTFDVPNVRYVPFVVHWRPAPFSQSNEEATAAIELVSGDDVLKNSRGQTVHVYRLLGDFGNSSVPVSTLYNPASSVRTSQGALWMNLLISHSRGFYIVKQPTPFYDLFGGNRRNLDLRFDLNPLEFITIQIETKTQAQLVDAEAYLAQYYGGFSVHGFSEEKVTL